MTLGRLIGRGFMLFGVAVFLLAGFLVVSVYIASQQNSSRSSDESPAQAQARERGPLPTIRITGTSADEVTFQDWKLDGGSLKGVITWHGAGKIEGADYTAKLNGIVKNRGSVSMPSYLRKDEPAEVTIQYGIFESDEQRAAYEITIDVE